VRVTTVTLGTKGRSATLFIMTIVLTGNVRIMIGVFGSACFFMFAAIAIYVMSDNLALIPRSQPWRAQSGAAGR